MNIEEAVNFINDVNRRYNFLSLSKAEIFNRCNEIAIKHCAPPSEYFFKYQYDLLGNIFNSSFIQLDSDDSDGEYVRLGYMLKHFEKDFKAYGFKQESSEIKLNGDKKLYEERISILYCGIYNSILFKYKGWHDNFENPDFDYIAMKYMNLIFMSDYKTFNINNNLYRIFTGVQTGGDTNHCAVRLDVENFNIFLREFPIKKEALENVDFSKLETYWFNDLYFNFNFKKVISVIKKPKDILICMARENRVVSLNDIYRVLNNDFDKNNADANLQAILNCLKNWVSDEYKEPPKIIRFKNCHISVINDSNDKIDTSLLKYKLAIINEFDENYEYFFVADPKDHAHIVRVIIELFSLVICCHSFLFGGIAFKRVIGDDEIFLFYKEKTSTLPENHLIYGIETL